MKIKTLAESIIEDLTKNVSITQIFNKVQVLAHHLKNDEFSQWVKNERDGYDDTAAIPTYRRVMLPICIVAHNIHQRVTNLELPFGFLNDEEWEEQIRTYNCCDRLSMIERFASNQNENKHAHITLSDFVINYIRQHYIQKYTVLETAYLMVQSEFFVGIIDAVNSKLLEFMLQMNDQIGETIDFDVMTKKKEIDRIFNQTINAGVVHTGDGQITLDNSTIVGGQNNTVDIDNSTKQQIADIVNQIESLSSDIQTDREDIATHIVEIRAELENKVQRPKWLKTAFNAIKGIVGVGEICELANKAILLLPEK
jgi:hypothetical protein